MTTAASPPSSILDPAHPFTRVLATFALVVCVGYVGLMALALRCVPPLMRCMNISTPEPNRIKPIVPDLPVIQTLPPLALCRLYIILPDRIKNGRLKPSTPAPTTTANPTTPGRRTTPAKTLVVLGSGGHTYEMLTMLRGLDASRYRPAVFVRADVRSRYGMVGWMHA